MIERTHFEMPLTDFEPGGRLVLLAEIEETNKNSGTGSFESLKSTHFDRHALAAKGLKYERLDQLTMDILFGVR